MIHINYIYKGSVVNTESLYLPYTQRNCSNVRSKIANGQIKQPENQERYMLTEFELDEKDKLFIRE